MAPPTARARKRPHLGRELRRGHCYASARLAGAGALLAGAGITNMSAQRALLINSALMLPSAYDAQAGAARYWTPDGGWGELALERLRTSRQRATGK